MLRLTRLVATAAVLVTTACVAGCGGSSTGTAAARVASTTISSSALDHWVAVMKTEHAVPPKHMARQQALSFLISSQWLIHEAASRGQGVSEREVQRRFEERIKEFSSGEAEFDDFLKLSGKTVADVRLEAKAELAAAKLLALLASRESKITEAQVSEYYKRNKPEFLTDEQRAVKVTYTKSDASARKIAEELRSGRRSVKEVPMESLEYGKRTRASDEPHSPDEPLYRAIYMATPNVFVGPVYNGQGYFFVFELTAIRRSTLEPFALVRGGIESHLVDEQRKHTIAQFVDEWRRKWVPRTDCDAGIVVQQCRQYKGPIAAEEPFPAS